MFICFVILLIQIKPVWGHVFKGYVPSSVSVTTSAGDENDVSKVEAVLQTIVQPNALYVAVGNIGVQSTPFCESKS